MHLMRGGFISNYIYWTNHEKEVIQKDDEEENNNIILNNFHYGSFTNAIIGEAEEVEGTNVLSQMLQDREREKCENEKVRKKLECMLEDHKTPLYLNCEQEHNKFNNIFEFLQ